jgi:hypothetical protein
MKANSSCDRGGSEHLGGLASGQPFPGYEGENFAISLRQGAEGTQHRVVHCRPLIGGSRQLAGAKPPAKRLATTRGSTVVGERPSRNAEQPGKGIVRNRLQAPPRNQECLADDVCRSLGIRSPERVAENSTMMGAVNTVESLNGARVLAFAPCRHIQGMSVTAQTVTG